MRSELETMTVRTSSSSFGVGGEKGEELSCWPARQAEPMASSHVRGLTGNKAEGVEEDS